MDKKSKVISGQDSRSLHDVRPSRRLTKFGYQNFAHMSKNKFLATRKHFDNFVKRNRYGQP